MSKFNRRIHFEEAIHTVSPACLMPFEADSVPNQATQVQKMVEKIIQSDLTPRQIDVIVLYYYEKQTLREIADQLGITESTACRTKNRACRRLSHYAYPNSIRKELSNHEDPDL